MDPLSQAVLGASLAQSSLKQSNLAQSPAKQKSTVVSACVIGLLAGMAPDLDVLIRADNNPMLFLEFHRQFTHSLVFIPVGALLCALVFYPVLHSKWLQVEIPFKTIYLWSFLAYATHGLLDACTSYGTQLFWPFSSERVAWNTVSIIDPLFTLPVLLLILLSVKRRRVSYARAAFMYALVYLSLGVIQNDRAEKAAYQLAQQRGHEIARLQVKPSFGNRHLWKILYEYDGRYYVDAVRLLLNSKVISGSSIQKLNLQRDFPWLSAESQQAKDIERFRWFSDDFLALNPSDASMIMDVRYSFVPNQIKMMWGVKIDSSLNDIENIDTHVKYEMNSRPSKQTLKQFVKMLF